MTTEAVAGANVDELFAYRLFIKDESSGLHFLVDTGANVSVLPVRPSDKRDHSPDNYLYAANKTPIPTYGERTITLDLGMRRPYSWTFVIAAVSRPIIGADFLHHHDLLVDLRGRKIIDRETNMHVRGYLTPLSEGSIRTIDDSKPYHNQLARFPDITRPTLPKICHSEVEHHIETTGAPVYAKARPLPPHKYKAAKEEFQEMLNQGICRPSNSPWASPLHMVLKKDGTYRACGDYRRLNAITVPDRYPIPRLHDFTYNLQGKKIFSKIDLKKAYYLIRNREEDIKKTAVITPFGLFEFSRMCFGLRNAGQTFQRHIDNVMRGLPVFCFVDDVLVASADETTHKQDLEEVFKRLNDNGLQINVAKCVFGQTKLDFLGYTITAEGITPTEEKVQAIQAYPLPETINDLRRFLGMINFYREGIPHAAENQRKLNEYLHNAKKNDKRKIAWNDDTTKAFQKCKQEIVNAARLSHPSINAPYALMTDASENCAGAVLQQHIHGRWKPLGFFSKKFNEAQRKYSTYDRELLSIYMAVRHFRRMFEGRELIIYTDHKPLLTALTTDSKNETPLRTRYLEFIGQFTSNIQHISGKLNGVADALSRISVEAIASPSPINYDDLATSQTRNACLNRMKEENKHDLREIIVPGTSAKITCEMSTGTARPFLTEEFRRPAHQAIHDLSHPGVRATRKLVTARYFWPSMNSDVNNWTKTCIQCQRTKIQRHTQSPVGAFEQVQRLAHLHIDIVGPLPTSAEGYRYLLTMIDRATKWPEAYPMSEITAERVAETLYTGWISRFGPPSRISSDRGAQFESDLFKKLMHRMGIEHCRSCAYHPQANGMIERWHRTLKASLTARLNTTTWVHELPTVLLGLRTAIKEDIGTSAAELLYGQPVRLPGEFHGEPVKQSFSPSHFMDQLTEALKKAQAQRKANKSRATFIHRELPNSTHVFVRNDAYRRPLTPAYDGPYRVLDRSDKFYKIQLPNRRDNISVDRLKPAFYINEDAEKSPEKETTFVTKSGRVSRPPVRFALAVGGE